MRITKKFQGVACIGKQVFQPCEQTQENAARIAEAQEARASAETARAAAAVTALRRI